MTAGSLRSLGMQNQSNTLLISKRSQEKTIVLHQQRGLIRFLIGKLFLKSKTCSVISNADISKNCLLYNNRIG